MNQQDFDKLFTVGERNMLKRFADYLSKRLCGGVEE